MLNFVSIMQKSYNTIMTNQQHVLIWHLISHNYQHVSSTSSIYITPHMSKSSTYINITLTVLTALHIFVTSVKSVDIWQIKFHAHCTYKTRHLTFNRSVKYLWKSSGFLSGKVRTVWNGYFTDRPKANL